MRDKENEASRFEKCIVRDNRGVRCKHLGNPANGLCAKHGGYQDTLWNDNDSEYGSAPQWAATDDALSELLSRVRSGLAVSVADVTSALRKYDSSNDGSLDLEEFEFAIKDLGFELTRKELLLLFNFVDADNSGSLEIQEFANALMPDQTGAADELAANDRIKQSSQFRRTKTPTASGRILLSFEQARAKYAELEDLVIETGQELTSMKPPPEPVAPPTFNKTTFIDKCDRLQTSIDKLKGKGTGHKGWAATFRSRLMNSAESIQVLEDKKSLVMQEHYATLVQRQVRRVQATKLVRKLHSKEVGQRRLERARGRQTRKTEVARSALLFKERYSALEDLDFESLRNSCLFPKALLSSNVEHTNAQIVAFRTAERKFLVQLHERIVRIQRWWRLCNVKENVKELLKVAAVLKIQRKWRSKTLARRISEMGRVHRWENRYKRAVETKHALEARWRQVLAAEREPAMQALHQMEMDRKRSPYLLLGQRTVPTLAEEPSSPDTVTARSTDKPCSEGMAGSQNVMVDLEDAKEQSSSLDSPAPAASPRALLLEAAALGDAPTLASLIYANGATKLPLRAICDSSGNTLLHVAAWAGYLHILDCLNYAAGGLPPSLVCSTNMDGVSPLHLAAAGGHTEFARLLIRQGANLQQLDKEGSTPLHYCASGGHGATAAMLLKAGCARTLQLRNMDGKTPFLCAVSADHSDAASVLMEFDVSVLDDSLPGEEQAGGAVFALARSPHAQLFAKALHSRVAAHILASESGRKRLETSASRECTRVLDFFLAGERSCASHKTVPMNRATPSPGQIDIAVNALGGRTSTVAPTVGAMQNASLLRERSRNKLNEGVELRRELLHRSSILPRIDQYKGAYPSTSSVWAAYSSAGVTPSPAQQRVEQARQGMFMQDVGLLRQAMARGRRAVPLPASLIAPSSRDTK